MASAASGIISASPKNIETMLRECSEAFLLDESAKFSVCVIVCRSKHVVIYPAHIKYADVAVLPTKVRRDPVKHSLTNMTESRLRVFWSDITGDAVVVPQSADLFCFFQRDTAISSTDIHANEFLKETPYLIGHPQIEERNRQVIYRGPVILCSPSMVDTLIANEIPHTHSVLYSERQHGDKMPLSREDIIRERKAVHIIDNRQDLQSPSNLSSSVMCRTYST